MLVPYVTSVALSVMLAHILTGFSEPVYAPLPLFAAAVFCCIPFAIVVFIRLLFSTTATEDAAIFRMSRGVYILASLFSVFVSPIAVVTIMMFHLMSDLSI